MMELFKKIIPKKLFTWLAPTYHFILSFFATVLFKFPSRKIIVIGVTGTAGKTSSSYMIYKMLQEAGYKTGLTSTAVFANGDEERLNDKKMTMPGRLFIQRSLRDMIKNNCVYAVIETTSEGIKQFRHRFINYDVILFTNLYPEHIESHGSFKNYKQAKGKLFAHLGRYKNKYVDSNNRVCKVKSGIKKIEYKRVLKTIIVNGDDKEADYFLNFWSEAKIIYSLDPNFNSQVLENKISTEASVKDLRVLRAELISVSKEGLELSVCGNNLKVPLLGAFNAKNILAAYALGLSQEIEAEEIKTGLEAVSSLAGKMEIIPEAKDFIAMVDYSFEPEALKNLYKTIELFSYNKLIHVLGSTGGGRDKTRRDKLGKLAGKTADIVIVTNEDPYDEDPQHIINEVASGAIGAGKVVDKDLFLILDRRTALAKAVNLAKAGDFVLATGKGAEQYICVAKGKKIAWDDRVELKKAIVDNL